MKKLDGRQLDHKTLEEMRVRAVRAVQDGMHPEEVVKALGFGKRCIYNWLAAYRAGGFAQLKARKLFGRPMKLNPLQIAWLYRTVAGTTPLQHRFEFALWTIRLVQWLIHDECRIKLSRSSVHRLMRQLGLSCQRPLHRAYEQDPARVERWRNEEFPVIRQLAKEAGAEIWFGDESGVRSDYHSGTTWSPKGTTPVVRKTGQRFKFNLLSIINNRGEMRFMLTESRVDNNLYIEFLQRLLKGVTRPVFLILDGHPVHRSRAVRDFATSTEGRLRLFFLPGYAPELNPDEQVWNEVKYRRVGRRSPRTKEQLRNLLNSAMFALQKLPRLILRRSGKRISPEVDGCTEDALERSDESSVLLATHMHAKAFEHLGRRPESDRSTLLLDGKSCEEDRNEAILAERNSELGMAGDLKCELAVSPLVEQLLFRQPPDRQSTQYERTRTETEVLILLFATDPDELDPPRLLELLSGDDKFRLLIAQQLANRRPGSIGTCSGGRRQ